MTRIKLAFLLLSLTNIVYAQDKADIASEGLKGNVKAIMTRGFATETHNGRTRKKFTMNTTIKRFNEEGYLIETVSGTGRDTNLVRGTGVVGARIIYKYDHLNYLVSSISYYPDGKMSDSSTHEVDKMGNRTYWKIYKSNGSLAYEYIKEYDNVGNLLETNDYHYGVLETRHTYFYNDNSKLIKESDYDPNGRLLWEQQIKYDDRNNRTEMIDFNTTTGAETRHYYKYDVNDRPIEEYEYGTPNSKKYKKTATKYDVEGNVVEIKQYSEEGVMIYEGRFDKYGNHLADIAYNEDGSLHDKITAEYKYDSRGNELEEALHYTDGSGSTSVSKYEYDAANNWIRKTVFEDGDATRLIERTIEYYY